MLQNIAEKTKLEVFHVLKTGKLLHRTNLFKSLFALADCSNYYRKVLFTDGFQSVRSNKKKRRRAVVELDVTTARENIDKIIVKLTNVFSEYIEEPNIKLNRNTLGCCLNINYGAVDWNKVDLAFESVKK